MAELRRIALLHGFSRANSGDGLLVDLTLEALADAGALADECVLLALDPESFADLPHVVCAPGEPTARPSWKLARAGGEVLASMAGRGQIRTELARADAAVAVGGGYLVADSLTRQGGVIANHLPQLRAAARLTAPTIYLPQSIGPLSGIAGHWARQQLARMDRVWLRDDASMAELQLPNARRCADLAVMKLARTLPVITPAITGEAAVLVGRDLPRRGDYLDRLRALQQLLPGCTWAVQADVAGPRSDRSFYRREGLGPDTGTLARALEQPGGPVISVRLHGAIAALLAGRPAIHLAYERKGWGAYQDLGLDDFVHDARRFDPATVAAQARALANDPAPFLHRIAMAAPALARQWDAMVADLAERLPPSR